MLLHILLAFVVEFIPEFPQSQSVQCGGNILGGSSLGVDHKRGNNNLLAVRVDGERIRTPGSGARSASCSCIIRCNFLHDLLQYLERLSAGD